MSRNSFRSRLNRGELILLDGAMGTELERRGIPTPLPLWSAAALLDHPDQVREIHEDYVRAGADVITADTFRTTPRALEKAGRAREEARVLTQRAVALAGEATDGARGASIPPGLPCGSQRSRGPGWPAERRSSAAAAVRDPSTSAPCGSHSHRFSSSSVAGDTAPSGGEPRARLPRTRCSTPLGEAR